MFDPVKTGLNVFQDMQRLIVPATNRLVVPSTLVVSSANLTVSHYYVLPWSVAAIFVVDPPTDTVRRTLGAAGVTKEASGVHFLGSD